MNRISQEPYNTDDMAKEFLMQFAGIPLTVGQTLVFSFLNKKLLGLAVKYIEGEWCDYCILFPQI